MASRSSQFALRYFALIAASLPLHLPAATPSAVDSMYYFGNGDPATSDGFLMVDFLAAAFNLPSPNADFGQRQTFDYDVAAAMDDAFFYRSGLTAGFRIGNRSLHSQFVSFSDSLDSLCSSPQECKSKLRNSVFVLDQIGSSDYQYSFLNGKSLKESYGLVDSVVFTTQYIVQKLIEMGATKVLVTGTLPMGCLPGYLTILGNPRRNDYLSYDRHGCLASMNTFSRVHNDHLQSALSKLRSLHPDVEIAFGDTYKAFTAVLRNHVLLGFKKDEMFKACCGSSRAGGRGVEFNFDPAKVCGKQGLRVCEDPSTRLSWDGFHLTQEAMKLVVDGLFVGERRSGLLLG
ncbi:unnamed protein product [Linum trigynum]|uniref:GDSL esterase/lipase n=1 Tax=Linum trigynum TaxID=586398 RepID=A0AAV2GWG4_9ROSI